MNSSLAQPRSSDLNRMIWVSVVAHVVVFLIFVLRFTGSRSEQILYQDAVQVDIVGLPEKAVSPTALATPPTPAPTPIEIKKPAAKIDEISLKTQQKKALNKIKELEAIEQIANAQKQKSKPIKGNALAPGTALQGLNRMEFNGYVGQIDHQIKANWVLPEWLTSANLHARLLVRIDKNGTVIDKKLLQSSNNQAYDAAAIDAVMRASPFVPPPEKLAKIVEVDGIIFQFPN